MFYVHVSCSILLNTLIYAIQTWTSARPVIAAAAVTNASTRKAATNAVVRADSVSLQTEEHATVSEPDRQTSVGGNGGNAAIFAEIGTFAMRRIDCHAS